MLSPKKVKYRKMMKGHRAGKAYRGSQVSFGDYGLQAVKDGWLTGRQVEAGRIAISRSIKRGGKVWCRVFPHKSITKKAAETRMGSGKGNPEYWVCVIKPGQVLFEMNGVTREQAESAFKLAAYKLPMQTRVIARE